MITCGCGYAFQDGDQFCGNCGTPFPAAQPADSPIPQGSGQQVPPLREHSAAPFFSHAAAPPRDTLEQPSPMSNATRYLCAAAYLDSGFANNAIEHLIASHRAVVPSRGIDLIPIMRHCLKA